MTSVDFPHAETLSATPLSAALIECFESNVVMTVRDDDVTFDVSLEGKQEMARLLERFARDRAKRPPIR